MNRFSEFDLVKKPLVPIAGYWAYPLVSLDQALAPLSSDINELQRSIEEARRHCRFPSQHNLTRDESAAIFLYTMEAGDYSFYHILNKILRDEDRSKAKKWFSYLKLFDTALRKLPTRRECIWRGVSGDLSKYYKENDEFTWWSITSCSLSAKEAEKFLNPKESSTLFMIEAVNGRDISGYTVFQEEKEVVLNIGTKFRVKSNALKHGKLNVVHLAEIDGGGRDAVSKDIGAMSLITASPIESKSSFPDLPIKARWIHQGVTVAGGRGGGGDNCQLQYPWGFDIDDDETIIIADRSNHRIMQWKKGSTSGQVAAGGRGGGKGMNQLNTPNGVLIDKQTNSLIILDDGNRRVLRWSRRSGTTQGEILIENVTGESLAMDDQRHLYVTDNENHAVRRYKIDEEDEEGTIVAGGNGTGDDLNQLSSVTGIFVDQQQGVYVSDNGNHRVMKWSKGAKEGVIVAGGKGKGTSLTQLDDPRGIFVDTTGTVYVAEGSNNRVTRWPQPLKRGSIVVGGNGQGNGLDQFYYPMCLSFDQHGNLYVLEYCNHRLQKFSLEK